MPQEREPCFQTRCILAQFLESIGETDGAIEYYRKALEMKPKHERTLIKVGQISASVHLYEVKDMRSHASFLCFLLVKGGNRLLHQGFEILPRESKTLVDRRIIVQRSWTPERSQTSIDQGAA